MQQSRRPEELPSCQPLGPRDPDLLTQCIRPLIRPILHCFYCRVKHVCVPASGSANQQYHRWLCPQSTKSHAPGTRCLRSMDPSVPVWTCCLATPLSPYPRVLRTDVSDGGLRNAAARRPRTTTQLPATWSQGPESNEPMHPTSYRPHITVGLNTSTFRPLDPGTESGTRVHVHDPPSPMILGPGVLDPRILRSSARTCCLATRCLPIPGSLEPRSRAVHAMPQPRRSAELPSYQPLGSPDPSLLSPMSPPTYRPVLHCTVWLNMSAFRFREPRVTRRSMSMVRQVPRSWDLVS